MFKDLLASEAGQLAVRWSLVLAGALLILLIGVWLARWIAAIARRAIERRTDDPALAGFVARTVFVVLCAMAVIGALDRIGVPTTSLVAALGAAGLAVGLALKDSLGNLASGVLIVFTRPFRAGDFVEIAGRSGTVERIDLMHTVLALPDNSLVSVPNGGVMTAPIVNFTARPTRRLELVFQVSLEDDPQRAIELVSTALRDHARVVAEPPPQVVLLRLAEGGFDIVARPWVRSGEVAPAQSELLALIGHLLTSNGFHAPQRTMRLLPHPESGRTRAPVVRSDNGG